MRHFFILMVGIIGLIPDSAFAIRGRALVLAATGRTTPGDLIMVTLDGNRRTNDTLVRGEVFGPGFSPDGKKVAYTLAGKVYTLDLATRVSDSVGTCALYDKQPAFSWSVDNCLYWSENDKYIHRINLTTKLRDTAFSSGGNNGSASVSMDGLRAAWVMPPVAGFLTGTKKTYQYMGGCGGAVSPSGKYLTSNLTTTHRLLTVFAFTDSGPTMQPVMTVKAPTTDPINGFRFSRNDDWIVYVNDVTNKSSGYVTYWRTDTYYKVSNNPVKDYFDETDIVPEAAVLDSIAVCYESPANVRIETDTAFVGDKRVLRVVGCYSKDGKPYECRITSGITWWSDPAEIAVSCSSYTAVAAVREGVVVAGYRSLLDTFRVTFRDNPGGSGWHGLYCRDSLFMNRVGTRLDTNIFYTFDVGRYLGMPYNNSDGIAVRWSAKLIVVDSGNYGFYFMNGEGNRHDVYVDDSLVLTSRDGGAPYPWVYIPDSTRRPLPLKPGLHDICVETVKKASQMCHAKLWWQGPNLPMQTIRPLYLFPDSTGSMALDVTTTKNALPVFNAYPNPTSSGVRIFIDGLRHGAYTFKVVNLLGRTVYHYDGRSLPSVKKLSWNGRDFHGNPLAAGLYTVSLQQENVVRFVRLTLIK